MSIKIVQNRLNNYQANNLVEQENALKEITQEIVLAALARGNFFKIAVFQGGTCLRIHYQIPRFSEDLDFCLKEPHYTFHWAPYLKNLQFELATYGYQIQIQDRSSQTGNIKTAFLKDDSIGKLLLLRHTNTVSSKLIKIKLEIDINPPMGGRAEQKYLDFPIVLPVLIHDLPTLFAGKSHALLCRTWEKGRDWFDFLWYVSRKVSPNFEFLSHALCQMGPWKDQKIEITSDWYLDQLEKKILTTDWTKNKQDIARFLKQSDLVLLNTWNKAFFLNRLEILQAYLK